MATKSNYTSYTSWFRSCADYYPVRSADRNYPPGKYAERPRCYICANEFIADSEHYEFTAKAQWMKGYSGFCTDVDMDPMKYWKTPSWAIFYRMILYDPEDRRYHVSGAALYPLDGRGRRVVPWDKHKGVLGYPEDTEQLATPQLANWPNDLEKSESLTGDMVHQLCWRRLARLIGLDAETNIRMLSHILRSRPGIKLSDGLRLPPGLVFVATDGATHGYPLNLQLKVPRRDKEPKDDDSSYDAAIQALIAKSRKRIEQNTPVSISRFAVESRITRLPLEIQYLIMNEIDGRRNVHLVRQQLRWILPDEYWRKRIDVVRYYEVEDIGGWSRDWEFLCLGLEELTAKENVKKNDSPRKMFMKTVYAIKLQFRYCLNNPGSVPGTRSRR